MKALILNSGLGSRLGRLTKDKPKCLLKLNNETILERQIRLLRAHGVTEYVITTGPFEEQIKKTVDAIEGINVSFIRNDEYMTTNYIVSIYKAASELEGDIILLHGDLVFDEKAIDILFSVDGSACMYNEKLPQPEKDFKCELYPDGRLKKVSVNIFGDGCYVFQPLYKIKKTDMKIWLDEIKTFVSEDKTNVYAEEALNVVSSRLKIYGVTYADAYITEVDTEEDYENCIRKLY